MLLSVRFWLASIVVVLAVAPLFAQQIANCRPSMFPRIRRIAVNWITSKLSSSSASAPSRNATIASLRPLRAYEEAARLDPDAAAPLRALAPIYLALDRTDDALEACRKALELDPDDYDTASFYGRQLRAVNKVKEAIAVLQRTAALPGMKERPDLRLQICHGTRRHLRDGRTI